MLNFHPNKLFSKTAQGPQFGGAQHRHLAQAYLLICLPVGPQLRLPGKVLDVAHVVPDEVGHHVSRVHVHDHQRAQRGALELGEVAADEVHDAHQVGGALLLKGRDLVDVLRIERILHALGPEHAGDHKHDHAWPLEHPLMARLAAVVLQAEAGLVVDALKHALFDLHEPLLHAAARLVGVDDVLERHALLLDGGHGRDGEVFLKLQQVHALKALLQVRLHARGVLGLTQDLQHLVVGEEEETREEQALLLQYVAGPDWHGPERTRRSTRDSSCAISTAFGFSCVLCCMLRHMLSTCRNFSPSSGICLTMSSLLKIGSR
mmetsp:Transcript_2161/g.5384  ORF Transcript_2161/g.5384 Transcript_2161/m.5384 type:complete len:319 (+) Transcript_2161:462-1418(+)